jgi:mono/diheme cytochrome c family protein
MLLGMDFRRVIEIEIAGNGMNAVRVSVRFLRLPQKGDGRYIQTFSGNVRSSIGSFRSKYMTNKARSIAALVAVILLSSASCFAQNPGEAIYKAKCQNCHGAAGLADSNMAKALKVKPVTDPSVTKMSVAEMVEATKNGMGKMTAFKDKLSDAEIKSSVDYFRSFIK